MVQKEIAPNLSYHYWYLGVQGLELEEEADPLVLVRGSEFNHEREIEMEDDEGHMGTATTRMSSYRTTATANPSFTDKCRYKEGWEDIWLLLLGSAKGGDGSDKDDIRKETVTTGVYKYTFKVNTDHPQDPYFCNLVNGFAKTEDDAYRYDNCLLSEFECSGSNEEAPTYTATFSSNYPRVNQPNPARVIPAKTVFPKSADVSVYIAPQGQLTTSNMDNYEFPCYLEWSFNVNNNLESVPCSGDEFGESTKVLGNREGEVSITVPWTNATKFLEKEFETGSFDPESDSNPTTVTTDNDEKTIWFVMENGVIGETQYKYKTTIKEMVADIDHAVKVGGIDHVGIGTDFDGGGGYTGIMAENDIINITMELMKKGYSDPDITKIMGGNMLRVMGEVQALANK